MKWQTLLTALTTLLVLMHCTNSFAIYPRIIQEHRKEMKKRIDPERFPPDSIEEQILLSTLSNARLAKRGMMSDNDDYIMEIINQYDMKMQKSKFERHDNSLETCFECSPGTISFNCSDECDSGTCHSEDQCQPCIIGSYNPISKQSKCLDCTPGYFCDSEGLTEMKPCPLGHYCPSRNMSKPYLCPSQTHCPKEGASTPTPCPAGYYCQEKGTIFPEKCPRDHYCPAKSSEPIRCSALRQSEPGSMACQLSPAVYAIVAVGLGCVACIAIFIIIKVRSKPSAKMQNIEQDPLIIPVPEGPEYSGL